MKNKNELSDYLNNFSKENAFKLLTTEKAQDFFGFYGIDYGSLKLSIRYGDRTPSAIVRAGVGVLDFGDSNKFYSFKGLVQLALNRKKFMNSGINEVNWSNHQDYIHLTSITDKYCLALAKKFNPFSDEDLSKMKENRLTFIKNSNQKTVSNIKQKIHSKKELSEFIENRTDYRFDILLANAIQLGKSNDSLKKLRFLFAQSSYKNHLKHLYTEFNIGLKIQGKKFYKNPFKELNEQSIKKTQLTILHKDLSGQIKTSGTFRRMFSSNSKFMKAPNGIDYSTVKYNKYIFANNGQGRQILKELNSFKDSIKSEIGFLGGHLLRTYDDLSSESLSYSKKIPIILSEGHSDTMLTFALRGQPITAGSAGGNTKFSEELLCSLSDYNVLSIPDNDIAGIDAAVKQICIFLLFKETKTELEKQQLAEMLQLPYKKRNFKVRPWTSIIPTTKDNFTQIDYENMTTTQKKECFINIKNLHPKSPWVQRVEQNIKRTLNTLFNDSSFLVEHTSYNNAFNFLKNNILHADFWDWSFDDNSKSSIKPKGYDFRDHFSDWTSEDEVISRLRDFENQFTPISLNKQSQN